MCSDKILFKASTMCFFSRLTLTVSQLKVRYKAEPEDMDNYMPSEEYNGFTFPATPVITNNSPEKIQLYNWGLMPSWAKDESFRKNTLNARIETLHEKPSFRPYLQNHCLILADGFYEWQWLDPKGTRKQKYLITTGDRQPFAFAGLWNTWTDRSTGIILNTYAIITKPANELMAEIHNTKQRMPFILSQENEKSWLEGKNIDFGDVMLVAKAI